MDGCEEVCLFARAMLIFFDGVLSGPGHMPFPALRNRLITNVPIPVDFFVPTQMHHIPEYGITNIIQFIFDKFLNTLDAGRSNHSTLV